jgi:hypothetical protein
MEENPMKPTDHAAVPRNLSIRAILLLASLTIVACANQSPAAPGEVTPAPSSRESASSVAPWATAGTSGALRASSASDLADASSACRAVAFHVVAVPSGPATFTGAVTGDLDGTVTVTFVGAPNVTGNTLVAPATASWTITGGVVPAPLAFVTEFDNRNMTSVRPGSPPTIIETLGAHRAVSGVGLANLHYDGVVTVGPSVVVNLDFRGVICP